MNENLIFALIGTLLVGYLIAGTWLVRTAPKPPKAGPKHGHGHDPVLLSADDEPYPVTFDCPGCGGESSMLDLSQTVLIARDGGFVLAGVCRAVRLHGDGGSRPCGITVCSAVVDAELAAVFADQGAQPVHPRMVMYRSELAKVHTADELAAAIDEAKASNT